MRVLEDVRSMVQDLDPSPKGFDVVERMSDLNFASVRWLLPLPFGSKSVPITWAYFSKDYSSVKAVLGSSDSEKISAAAKRFIFIFKHFDL